MFTGIIQTTARVERVLARGGGARLTLAPTRRLSRLVLGESIAVDGACLTVTSGNGKHFTVDVSPETLRRTTVGALARGGRVNLERSLRLGDRLGGHIVLGHVDGVGRLGCDHAGRRLGPVSLPRAEADLALPGGEGLDRRRRRQPHPVPVSGWTIHGRADPAHAGGDDARRTRSRRSRQPRGRRDAEAHRGDAALRAGRSPAGGPSAPGRSGAPHPLTRSPTRSARRRLAAGPPERVLRAARPTGYPGPPDGCADDRGGGPGGESPGPGDFLRRRAAWRAARDRDRAGGCGSPSPRPRCASSTTSRRRRPRRCDGPLLGVVKDDAEGPALAGSHVAHAVAHGHAVRTARAGDRPVPIREDDGLTLRERDRPSA